MRNRLVPTLVALSCALLTFSGCGGGEEDSQTTPAAQARTAAPEKKELRFATIGTGGMTGVYYPTGGYIAKMVNQKRDQYGLRCTHESTKGSVFNINAVLVGDLEFGIAQSDRQYQAVKGIEEWKEVEKIDESKTSKTVEEIEKSKMKGPQKDLRAVFSIHPESITLVAAEDAGIETIGDLRGKRVNIGNPGSGQRQNAIDAIENAGLNFKTDLKAESVKASEAAGMLQDDKIDAFFYTVGHPSGAIMEATAGHRKVRFVPLTDLEGLLEKLPYYTSATIEVSHYPQATNKEDVATFGVRATFITSAKVPDDMVYAITKEVFDNLEEFKKLHPAYSSLTRRNMLEGLSAPLHPGAIKYYKEAGLMK